MSDGSKIEWTDATWNPITGCSVVSAGCKHCYAMRLAGTRLRHHPSRAELTRETSAGPVWTGEVRLNEQWLDQPLHWRRPRRIFVCAHGDLFHPAVPDEWIDRVFATMALAPQHTFQVLTKRPERMRAWVRNGRSLQVVLQHWKNSRVGQNTWPLPNVWLGVSVEDQAAADERIPVLLDTPAAVRFISAEPLLGVVNLRWLGSGLGSHDALIDDHHGLPRLDWVIAGGESGPGARPSHPDWFRALRDQCQAAGVPYFFKQWGEWAPTPAWTILDPACAGELVGKTTLSGHHPGERSYIAMPNQIDTKVGRVDTLYRVGKRAAGRLLDGREWNDLPVGAP